MNGKSIHEMFFLKLQLLNDFGWNASNDAVVGDVFGDNGTSSYNHMLANCYSWQNNRIGSNPHIILNHNRFCGEPLFVNPARGVFKIVIQGSDSDALGQVYMIPNSYGPDNRVVNTDTGIIADDDIPHRIIYAAKRFYDTSLTQRKFAVGWCVHSNT